LVVVPVVYCYLDDLARWAARKWAGSTVRGAAAVAGGASK